MHPVDITPLVYRPNNSSTRYAWYLIELPHFDTGKELTSQANYLCLFFVQIKKMFRHLEALFYMQRRVGYSVKCLPIPAT